MQWDTNGGKTLYTRVIEATIATGKYIGEDVFIPRIPLLPSDCPFEFKRLQFPVHLCFAITINKSQSQSLKAAGLHLIENCFSHDQYYVACSLVGSPEHLFLLTKLGKRKLLYARKL